MANSNKQLRAMVEDVVRETFERKKDVVYDLLCTAVEDVGMVNAIRAGARSRTVSRQTVNKLLASRK